MKKAQTWSMDVVIAVIVFLATVVVFFAVLNTDPGRKAEDIRDETDQVISLIKSEDSSLRILNNKEINESRLLELSDKDFDELKRNAGVKNDFCIYLEDEEGNIVPIGNTTTGIGSDSINVSGQPCD